MPLKESGENYLEAILYLEKKNNVVRVIDIADYFGYSRASVSKAMSILKSSGYIQKESYGNIFLTELGRDKANEIYDIHILIKKFLISTLNLDEKTAEKDACKIEHIISKKTISEIKKFITKNS